MDNKETKIALPVGTTLDRFIMRKEKDFPYATGELSQLLRDIALASKIVNREINRAGLMDISGAYGSQNVQGEEQQKLDVIANIRFIRAFRNGGEVCTIISEEDDEAIQTQLKYALRDEFSLLFAGDRGLALTRLREAQPPVVTLDLGLRGWTPTLQLTAHLRAVPAPGWLLLSHATRNFAGGLLEEDAEVWDSSGRLVAQSRQLARAPRPDR